MAKQFLITRPTHDKRTSYMHSFSKPIVLLARETTDIHVTELEGSDANRGNLEKSLTRENPRFVFLNGHGDRKSVWGHKDKVILDEVNIALTQGKIIYALACDSLAELGDIAVDKGIDAYIGYEKEFRWVVDPSRTSSPEKDRNAAPFRRACFVLGKSLLSGKSAGDSVELTRKEYEKLIRTYASSSDYYGDAPLIGFGLAWNLLFLGMKGNPDAVF